MLKHEMTYEDFNGDQVTETLYFNITKSEMVELEVEHKEGMQQWIDSIVKAEDRKQLIAEFKKILLFAYGEKTSDGKRFIKSDEIRENFSQTAAYDALFLKLSTDAEFSANFIKGILPKDLAEQAEKAAKELQTSPPVPNS